MNQSVFLNTIGKKATYTSNGIYEFAGSIISVLQNCYAWYDLEHSSVTTINGLEFHTIIAYNASYWKTDGQEVAAHLVVYDKSTDTAWIENVITGWTQGDMTKVVRRYKKMSVELAKLSKEEITEKLVDKRKMYSSQISTNGK